ncbi:Cystatin domain-containing protein [Spironucleus salmonicida]|uniref:Cystatin domain-containing protein n=1 Tax=Spironucleus salmonicida TaxID=348837 RepID=V6LB74_9EUKA|nr:Cystatin domain-containing protein [Spironucleus salmonicida]|eukprot:EST41498.1 Cystatin domain-containing protein [Spironucleus salmonicida]
MLILFAMTAVGGYTNHSDTQLPPNIEKQFIKQTKQYKHVEITSLSTQVVAGINYKLHVNLDGKQATIVFWAKLDKTVEFKGIQWIKND